MNTGMPSSGPLIVESINKLDLKPEDIKVMINGHAHIDHAGAFAYLKQRVPGAELAVMREDVPAMESGDKGLQICRRLGLSGREGRSRAA